MIEAKGPTFDDPLVTPNDINKLKEKVDVRKELGYVMEAITLTRRELKGRVPLFGFIGAPWTLLAYMVEGGGSKTFTKAKQWLYKYSEETKGLLQRITDIGIDFLAEQVIAGAQVQHLESVTQCADRPGIRLLGGRIIAKRLCNVLTPISCADTDKTPCTT